MNSSTIISRSDVVYPRKGTPELFLWDPNHSLQCVWLWYQLGKMIRFRIWIITVLTVLDEVSSSLSCIGTEIGDRSHIYKSCYLFILLLQALEKILENLLWWLSWDLILLSTGLGNETGLKKHHALFIFIHQLCQHGFLWPCYKPVHESTWVKNSPFLGLFAFHHSYCSDAVTAVISKQLYQHVPCCWPETQDCPHLHYWQRWCSVKLQPWH